MAGVELLRQKIHMDRIKSESMVQLALEEDVNLPETKPDVDMLCMEHGYVVTEETEAAQGEVKVRGRLVFSVLYYTWEEGGRLVCMEGRIPFDERIRMEGVTALDSVEVDCEVEDLTIGMINSRKLSVQAVVTMKAQARVTQDLELPVGLEGSMRDGASSGRGNGMRDGAASVYGSGMRDGETSAFDREEGYGTNSAMAEYRRVPAEFAQLVLSKRDVIRIKEELELASGYPNIREVLWRSAETGEMSFRLGEEKLYVQGELKCFVLFLGEEGSDPQIFETSLPISAQIPCPGCREGMTVDVRYGMAQWEISAAADSDGERRHICPDVTLELRIGIYEEGNAMVLTDIYGTDCEIEGQQEEVELSKLLRSVTGKTRISHSLKPEGSLQSALIIRSEASAIVTDIQAGRDSLKISGNLCVKILYATGDDQQPYGCIRERIPFEYVMEVPGLDPEDLPANVQTKVEQFTVTIPDGEELDIRAVISFSAMLFHKRKEQVIGSVLENAPDVLEKASLPGIVIYVVKAGDRLWDIGKKYSVPVQRIAEMNGMSGTGGTGMNGSGMNGSGMNGTGMNGSGMNGNGINGYGMNGINGLAEIEPEVGKKLLIVRGA